jgi:LuxR family maltose regulon positive regulatory protein
MAVRWTDWLDEYYREQVLEQLPLDLQRVISRLVIVEHFDPSLARAIVGHDVGAVLERLHYEEGLLSVDARTGLLQFPALLRESLCKRLQWLDATELTALHRRAGAWFAERGLYNEALYHALAAGDAATAVPLFQRIGGSAMLMRSGLPTLRAALEQMQSANTVGPEVFGWSRVLLLSQEGQSAEAWRVARSISPDQDSSVPAAAMVSPAMTRESREGAMIAGLLAAYVDQRLPADRAQALQRIGAQLPQQEHIYHGFISTVLCWLKCEQAEFGDAAIEAERAILEFTADNGLYGSLFMHLHRVVIRYWQNRLDEALAEAEQLARLKRLFFPEDLRFDWLCRVFRAFVLFELGRLDAAAELLKDTVEGSVASEGWPEPHLIAYQTSAKIAAARGDFAAAEDILRQGEHIARERSLPRLQWHLRWQLADLRLTAEVNARLQPELEFRFDPEQDPEYFTWRERFLSAVISTRHATHERDYEGAGRILDQIESELALTDVPRAGSQVALLRARIAAAQGDSAGADRAVRRAMSTFGGVLAVQLFREAGFPAVVAMAAATNDAIAERSGGVAAPPAMLTQREREILDLLAAGHPNKIVAHQVGVSEATVKFHLKNIYRKLKARNRVQALARHRQTAE